MATLKESNFIIKFKWFWFYEFWPILKKRENSYIILKNHHNTSDIGDVWNYA